MTRRVILHNAFFALPFVLYPEADFSASAFKERERVSASCAMPRPNEKFCWGRDRRDEEIVGIEARLVMQQFQQCRE